MKTQKERKKESKKERKKETKKERNKRTKWRANNAENQRRTSEKCDGNGLGLDLLILVIC